MTLAAAARGEYAFYRSHLDSCARDYIRARIPLAHASLARYILYIYLCKSILRSTEDINCH